VKDNILFTDLQLAFWCSWCWENSAVFRDCG